MFTRRQIKELRTKQDGFESVWCDAIDLAKSCNIVILQESGQITGKGRRKTTMPTKLQTSVVFTTLVDHPCGHSKDSFKLEVFYPIIDILYLILIEDSPSETVK